MREVPVHVVTSLDLKSAGSWTSQVQCCAQAWAQRKGRGGAPPRRVNMDVDDDDLLRDDDLDVRKQESSSPDGSQESESRKPAKKRKRGKSSAKKKKLSLKTSAAGASTSSLGDQLQQENGMPLHLVPRPKPRPKRRLRQKLRQQRASRLARRTHRKAMTAGRSAACVESGFSMTLSTKIKASARTATTAQGSSTGWLRSKSAVTRSKSCQPRMGLQ